MDAAADAAIAVIRQEAADLKAELQRACVGELDELVRERVQLLTDVELAAASPEGGIAGSEASRCLLTAVTRACYPYTDAFMHV